MNVVFPTPIFPETAINFGILLREKRGSSLRVYTHRYVLKAFLDYIIYIRLTSIEIIQIEILTV